MANDVTVHSTDSANDRNLDNQNPPRLSARISSHRNAGDLIPLEVIESWLRGEYLVGITQSTGYQYIGWSLLLRGFYEYSNTLDGRVAHWGYCYIDLKDGDLYFAGVRINSGEQWLRVDTTSKQPSFVEINHPIYWHSVFSKFVGLESEEIPRLYFGYIAHLLETRPGGAAMQSYQDYFARAGDDKQGFFEWYFKKTSGDRVLSRVDERRLQTMDQFWCDACRLTDQDTLPDKPDFDRIEPFRQTVLAYLADRDRFDSDLSLLEQLHPNQRILALLNLHLGTVKAGSLEAILQPLERDIPAGKFFFKRLPQPVFD